MASIIKPKRVDCYHCGEKDVDHYYLYTDRDSNGIETESYECGICRCVSHFQVPTGVNVNKYTPEGGTYSDCEYCGAIATCYTVVYAKTSYDSYNNREKIQRTKHSSCRTCGHKAAWHLPNDYGPNPCGDIGTSRTPQESVTDNNTLSGQCTCGADSVGGFHSKWCDKRV